MDDQYLFRRGNTYYVRKRIPQDLISKFDGRREIVRSLETKDPQSANIRKHKALSEILASFEEARAKLAGRAISRRDIYWSFRRQIEAEASQYRSTEELLEHSKLVTEVNEERYDALEQGAEPHSELIARMDALEDVILQIAGTPKRLKPEYEEPFNTSVDRYIEHLKRDKDLNNQSINQILKTYRLFSLEYRNKPMATVTKAEAVAFVDKLNKVPSRWSTWKDVDRAELTLDLIIARAKDGDTLLATATKNSYINELGRLWKWLHRRDEVRGENPFQGLTMTAPRNREAHLPYTEPELIKYFSSDIRRRWLKQIPFVGLYTGMRQSETAELQWKNICERDGCFYFDVTAAKTVAGIRQIPIHSTLMPMFEHRGEAEEYIWPMLRPQGPDQKRGQYVSKEYGKTKRKTGITRANTTYHSLRKNFITNLRNQQVAEQSVRPIVGHEGTGITYTVYTPDTMPVGQLRDIVELVSFPELEASGVLEDLQRPILP